MKPFTGYIASMPRKVRIDAPGALLHIICSDIGGRTVFQDVADCNEYMECLTHIIIETETRCFAGARVPNYFHLLLKTAQVPVVG